eukprot:GHVQ01013141.1.p1 GENE.GHVQ01013141.1~~GHVQ01013141.1.p1  ORF type:complete len:521 (+),score=47.37 GHVQ01013141.1:294-1856(+)
MYFKESFKWSPNIMLMLYFRLFNGIAFAARSAAVFDAYLHLQFGSNQTVGLVTSLNAVASLLAPVAGILSDRWKHSRAKLLRICAVTSIGCIVLNYLAILYDSLALIIISTVLWRAWYEFVFVTSESLFTDSIPYGYRSELFVYRRMVTTLANGVGPLISLLLFWTAGNFWTVEILHTVLLTGTLCSFPQVITLWYWEDVSIDETSSPVLNPDTTDPQSYHIINSSAVDVTECAMSHHKDITTVDYIKHDKGLSTHSKEECMLLITASSATPNDSLPASAVSSSIPCLQPETLGRALSYRGDVICRQDHLIEDKTHNIVCDKQKINKRTTNSSRPLLTESSVPWLVFTSHLITFAGAGMTVKYFPLFFKQEYGFKPIHTCLLSSVYTLFIATSTYVISAVARHTGRAQASLMFTFAGICGLFMMTRIYWLPLVIATYLIRGGLQNASTPIDRSIMMDYIDAKNTGKWTGLQSMASMSWAASALLGGMLADVNNYRFTFAITGSSFSTWCSASTLSCSVTA